MSIRPYFLTFAVIWMLTFLIANCATKPDTSSPPALKNYVSLELAYPKYQAILQHLQQGIERKLKSRGEAHITVVTPPEFEILKSKLSPAQIHALAAGFLKKPISFEHVCLGQGKKKIKDQIEQVFFIVVTSSELLQLRRALTEEGHFNKTEFDPELFFPHITLGFTDRDLYFEDGIIKNKAACPQKLQNLLVTE